MHRTAVLHRLFLFVAIALLSLAASCTPPKAPSAVYALVLRGSSVEDTRLSASFAAALAEGRGEPLVLTPEKPRAALQASLIADCVTRGVAGIAVDALDAEPLREALQAAIAAGIPVVVFGDGPDLGEGALWMDAYDPASLAAQLAKALKARFPASVQYAIVAGQATDDETNRLLELFKQEAGASLSPVRLGYALSERDGGATTVSGLLTAYPRLECVVALSPAGLAAAARVVADRKKGLKPLVIGPGDALEMAPHLESGLCPQLFARNPEDTAYLAACALKAFAAGKMTGKAGESFDAGRLGTKTLAAPWTDGASARIPGPAPVGVDKAGLAAYRSAP